MPVPEDFSGFYSHKGISRLAIGGALVFGLIKSRAGDTTN